MLTSWPARKLGSWSEFAAELACSKIGILLEFSCQAACSILEIRLNLAPEMACSKIDLNSAEIYLPCWKAENWNPAELYCRAGLQ